MSLKGLTRSLDTIHLHDYMDTGLTGGRGPSWGAVLPLLPGWNLVPWAWTDPSGAPRVRLLCPRPPPCTLAGELKVYCQPPNHQVLAIEGSTLEDLCGSIELKTEKPLELTQP